MINGRECNTGDTYRADGSVINTANILAPSPLNHETLIIDDNPLGVPLTSTKYNGAKVATIQIGAAPIRFWLDGAPPTITEGILLNDGDSILLTSIEEIIGFKAIRTTEVSAIAQVYYGG